MNQGRVTGELAIADCNEARLACWMEARMKALRRAVQNKLAPQCAVSEVLQ